MALAIYFSAFFHVGGNFTIYISSDEIVCESCVDLVMLLLVKLITPYVLSLFVFLYRAIIKYLTRLPATHANFPKAHQRQSKNPEDT